MAPDPRLVQSEGNAVLGTPMLLLRTALSAGVDVVIAARLGSPPAVAEMLEANRAWLWENGVEALVLPEAAQAAAAARGVLDAGRTGLLLLEVGSAGAVGQGLLWGDGVALPNTAGGGVVLACGVMDAPAGRAGAERWSRCGVSVLEPGLHAEVGPWFEVALKSSAMSGGVTVLGLAGELWGGFTSVACGDFKTRGGSSVTDGVGRRTGAVQGGVIEAAREAGVNAIINPPGRDEALPLGLVAGGVGYARLRQLVSELGLVGRLPILRLGLIAPLDVELLERHARDCRRLLVVDGRDGPMFGVVADALRSLEDPEAGRAVPLLEGPDCSPATLLHALSPYLQEHPGMPREVIAGALAGLEAQARSVVERNTDAAEPDRLPPPGSALVDVAAVLGRLRRDLTDAQYMTEQHGSAPIDLAVFGELDDQSRLLLEHEQPIAGGSVVRGDWAGGAAMATGRASGLRPVVLMNGREMFASGYAAIAAAVREGRDITFVVHTEEPVELRRRRRGWLGRRQPAGVLDLSAMLEALAPGRQEPGVSVGAIDPTDRPRLRRLLERSVVGKGPHVVVARRRAGPRALRAQAQRWQERAFTDGYIGTQQRLVLCPEVWPLNPSQRLQLGPLGLEPAPGTLGGWMTAGSWAWGGKPMHNALANPALGLATIMRTGPERSRLDDGDLAGLPPLPTPLHADQEVWRASIAGVAGAGLDLLARLLVEAGSAMGYRVTGTLDVESMEPGEAGRVGVMFTSASRGPALSVAGAPQRSTRPLFSATATPGTADLVLGAECEAGLRALVSGGVVARTGAVVDPVALPTLDALAADTPQVARVERLNHALAEMAHPDRRAVVPAAELSEYLWGHRRFAAWVMLGVVLQRGLAPLTPAAVEQATRRLIGKQDARCTAAIEVGRKLAVDPGFADRCLSPEPQDTEHRLATAVEDLAQQYGGRHGPALSREFAGVVQPLLDRCDGLAEAVRAHLVRVCYRCVVWGGRRRGLAYARRFCDTIGLLLDHDAADRGYELTGRGIEGAARAMLVPDEVYLATLLTAPARYRRDRRRLNVALEQGDRVAYRHVVRPEFDLFKRHIAFNLSMGERALRLLARLHVVRRVRTGWYREQRDFRDRYLQTLAGVSDTSAAGDYRKWCEIASSAVHITGRGETRRQHVQAASDRLDRLAAVDAKELDRG